MVTFGEVVSYIKDKGYSYKQSGKELRLKNCPFCETEKEGDYTHFYFDTEKGIYFCHKCQNRGNLYKFKIEMGDIEPIRKARQVVYVRPKEIKLVMNFYDAYFKERGISPTTLEKYKVGSANHIEIGKCIVYSYYNEKKELINYKYRNKQKEQRISKGAEINYYGLQFVDFEKKYLFVVEGEDDCHAMNDYGFDNVVSLPMGAKNYSEPMHKINKKFTQIYMFFDVDEVGQAGARGFAEKCGLYKCDNVLLPFKDARECLINKISKDEILECIGRAKKFKHRNIIKAGDLKQDFLNFVTNEKEYDGVKLSRSTRFTDIIRGLRSGELTVLTGQTGCGKSTYAYNIGMWFEEEEEKTLIASFELKILQTIAKLVMIDTGDQIKGSTFDWKSKAIDDLNKRNVYLLNVFGYYSLENLGVIIEYGKKYFGINLFIVDHLHYFLKTSHDERKEIDNAVRTIKGWSIEYDIHIILVVHPHATKSDEEITINSLKGASSIKQECDNFIIVKRLTKDSGEYECDSDKPTAEVTINKNRAFGNTGKIEYFVRRNNNSFSETI